MGTRRLFGSLLVAMSSVAIAAPEPLELNGVGTGITEVQLVARIPGFVCQAVPAELRADAGGGDRACTRDGTTLAGHPANGIAMFEHGRLESITYIDINPRQLESIVAHLTKRFGPPKDQNAVGSTRSFLWNVDGQWLTVANVDGSTSGMLTSEPVEL